MSPVYVDLDCTLSDHFPLLFSLTTSVSQQKWISGSEKRNYKSIHLPTFSEDLSSSLAANFKFTDPIFSLCLANFNGTISQCLDRHALICKSKTRYKSRPPWLDNDYVLQRAKRRKLERLYKRTKLPADKVRYIEQRSYCEVLVKSKRCHYYKTSISACNGNQKALFGLIKQLLGTDGSDEAFPVLIDNESNILSDTDIATGFNTFFVEKIDKIRNDLPRLSSTTTMVHKPVATCSSTLSEFDPCTKGEIKQYLMSSGCKTSSVVDLFPTFLLSHCIDDLIVYLTHLVNLSLTTGSVDGLKEACVRPVIKNNHCDPDKYQSYRPISNLSFVSKLIEKTVLTRLNTHMNSNKLLNNRQFGYKQNLSCESLLLKFVNDLFVNMENKRGVVVLMCDLSAAFDTVNHHKLLSILRDNLCVSGIALHWFESFLSGRCQRVVVKNSCSPLNRLAFGVPQGSVLGPVLFNIYTQSLSKVFSECNHKSLSYADDTTGYFSFNIETQDSINVSVNKCINDVKVWMNMHFLKLNEDKTQIIVFGNNTLHQNLTLDKISFIDSVGKLNYLPFAEKAKYLGVHLDNRLSFNSQINSVCSSCNYYLKEISSIRSFIGKAECESLVNAFVTSRLDYCNSLYVGISKTLISKLQKVQNSAARLILQKGKRDSISLCLSQLHWLNIEKRIAFKVLTIVYKCMNGSAPLLVSNMLSPCLSSSRNSDHTLNIIFHHTKNGRQAFSYHAPRLWNCLPLPIRSANSLVIFKSKLKTYLFSSYDVLKLNCCQYAKILL
jgi:hypothetical protein